MFDLDIPQLIARLIVLMIAFTIHELAHAVTADYLGDSTPRRMGRISLNPLVHLDPLGSILLLVSGFGWAKPVLVNPLNMRGNPRTAMAIVAIAGPLSNILMAVLGAIPLRLMLTGGGIPFGSSSTILPDLGYLLFEFVWINVILAFFNLIPLAPLDGSKVLAGVLPAQMAYQLRPLEQYGPLILLALIFLPSFLPIPNAISLLIGGPAQSFTFFLLGL